MSEIPSGFDDQSEKVPSSVHDDNNSVYAEVGQEISNSKIPTLIMRKVCTGITTDSNNDMDKIGNFLEENLSKESIVVPIENYYSSINNINESVENAIIGNKKISKVVKRGVRRNQDRRGSNLRIDSLSEIFGNDPKRKYVLILSSFDQVESNNQPVVLENLYRDVKKSSNVHVVIISNGSIVAKKPVSTIQKGYEGLSTYNGEISLYKPVWE